jgi:hypothetical protein
MLVYRFVKKTRPYSTPCLGVGKVMHWCLQSNVGSKKILDVNLKRVFNQNIINSAAQIIIYLQYYLLQ